ncbi:MAG: DNA-3-methyladenine glycosylase 2 family protein [Gammaproteobacteria bacterium]|nr:MAG: DNA-3-methyladenine glycosylase 2 family protein [Gammaproteobacteria bacterium]
MTATERPLTKDSLDRACRILADRDPHLGVSYTRHGTPPLWKRRPGFRTLVQIVLEQQVSLASGRATLKRIEATFGPVTAARLAKAGQEGLRSVGVTRQKARYCALLAEASRAGDLNLRKISRSRDRDAMSALTAFKGIGSWTAEVYLLMALGRPDVWPAGDLALAKAIQTVKQLPERPDEESMRVLAQPWSPFRAVAARMLWHDYLQRDRRVQAP